MRLFSNNLPIAHTLIHTHTQTHIHIPISREGKRLGGIEEILVLGLRCMNGMIILRCHPQTHTGIKVKEDVCGSNLNINEVIVLCRDMFVISSSIHVGVCL